MANQTANLGWIHYDRGEIRNVRECWTKAIGLYMKVGIPHTVEKYEKLLKMLPNDLS